MAMDMIARDTLGLMYDEILTLATKDGVIDEGQYLKLLRYHSDYCENAGGFKMNEEPKVRKQGKPKVAPKVYGGDVRCIVIEEGYCMARLEKGKLEYKCTAKAKFGNLCGRHNPQFLKKGQTDCGLVTEDRKDFNINKPKKGGMSYQGKEYHPLDWKHPPIIWKENADEVMEDAKPAESEEDAKPDKPDEVEGVEEAEEDAKAEEVVEVEEDAKAVEAVEADKPDEAVEADKPDEVGESEEDAKVEEAVESEEDAKPAESDEDDGMGVGFGLIELDEDKEDLHESESSEDYSVSDDDGSDDDELNIVIFEGVEYCLHIGMGKQGGTVAVTSTGMVMGEWDSELEVIDFDNPDAKELHELKKNR